MSVVLPVSVYSAIEWQRVSVLSQNVAVLHCMWRESVLCVDVQCGKICCFITFFESGEHFSSKVAQIRKSFIPILHTAILGNTFYTLKKCLNNGVIAVHFGNLNDRGDAWGATPILVAKATDGWTPTHMVNSRGADPYAVLAKWSTLAPMHAIFRSDQERALMTLLDPREAHKGPCAEGGTIAAGTGFPKLEYPMLPKKSI